MSSKSKSTREAKRIEELEKQLKLVRGRKKLSVHDWYGKHAKIGVVSDTHIGSLFCNLDLLQAAYRVFRKEGIQSVYHPGDLVDGEKMYTGHEYEIYAHGFDAQVREAVETYPCYKDIRTYFITGNHDHAYWKSIGASVGEAVAGRRDDMIFLGMDQHDVKIGKLILRLIHPGKGTAYAISYHPQKYIEALTGGEKPHILLMGHYHKMEEIFYRNVHLFQSGTIQSQTPYMKRNNNAAMMGFWIIDIWQNAQGIGSVQSKWFPHFEGNNS